MDIISFQLGVCLKVFLYKGVFLKSNEVSKGAGGAFLVEVPSMGMGTDIFWNSPFNGLLRYIMTKDVLRLFDPWSNLES